MTPQQWRYPTAFSHWGEEEDAAIERVRHSQRFTMGEEVEAFEEEFARYHDRLHAIMVNSGSSANLVAVAALMHQKQLSTRAIVPALAWSTTYAPLVQYDCDLALADCDQTWNALPMLWREEGRAPAADIMIACSILGNPGYLRQWQTLAEETGAALIEDNCESLGAITPEGKFCGTYGLLSTFSFFYSHQISAIEGGMILTDDHDLAVLCRMLRAHGWTRDVPIAFEPRSFEDEYDFRVFGYNVRPLEMHAAIAREQLRKLEGFGVMRRHNAAVFRIQVRQHCPFLTLPQLRGTTNPFGLHFLCESREQRARLVKALRAAGIDCRLPTGGSFRKHAYGAPWNAQETPVADQIHDCGMFLGNPPYDWSEEIVRAVEVMKREWRPDTVIGHPPTATPVEA